MSPVIVTAAAVVIVLLLAVFFSVVVRRRERARQQYREMLERALADGRLSADEVAELDHLRAAKELTHTEVRMIARAVYRGALRDALQDARLTPEEDAQLTRLQAELGLAERELGDDQEQLSRLRMLAQVEAGHLPEVEAPVPLVPGETCHWLVQSALAERLELPVEKPEPAGITLRVLSDDAFTVEGVRDALRPAEEILPVDLGIVAVTSRRTVFQGAKRTISIPHARLDSLVLHADGLRLDELNGATRRYLLVEDAELTAAILLLSARRRRAEIRPARGRSA